MTDAVKEKKEKKPKPVRFTTVGGVVSDFISEGFSEAEEIGSEFREIFDNAPENLQQTDTNQRRDAIASELENLSDPGCDSDILGELDCSASLDNGKVYRGRMSQSRACRAANAAAKLRAAVDAINNWVGENEAIEDADPNDAEALKERAAKLEELESKGWDVDSYNSALESADDLVSTLEEAADVLENGDYPGMFG